MSKCQLGCEGVALSDRPVPPTGQLACLVIWMTCGMWTGEQGGNGTSIQRSKFRKFHNLIVRKKFGALVVVHNLFSSIENLHTSSSKHVLALKDNTPRFLRLFQLRNRRGAQILLFNASTLLVRRLVHLFRVSRGTLLEDGAGGDLKGPYLRHLIFGCLSGKTEDSWFKNTMIKAPALFYFEWKKLYWFLSSERRFFS